MRQLGDIVRPGEILVFNWGKYHTGVLLSNTKALLLSSNPPKIIRMGDVFLPNCMLIDIPEEGGGEMQAYGIRVDCRDDLVVGLPKTR